MLLPQRPQCAGMYVTSRHGLVILGNDLGIYFGPMHSDLRRGLNANFDLIAFDGNDGDANLITNRNAFS
jgi:hypothetical protein